MRTLVDADIPVYSLAKASLFKVPVVGQVLAAGGQIPVQRGTAHATDALAEAAKRLQEGSCIIIFPEGTLSRDPLKWPMLVNRGGAPSHAVGCARDSYGPVGCSLYFGHLLAPPKGG